jgi:hypothetical protein
MSGLNIAGAKDGFYRNLDTMSTENQETELRMYCNQHPLDSFTNAVIYLYGEFDSEEYKPKSK